MGLSEKQIGFWGLVVGAIGLLLAMVATFLSWFFWTNTPPHEKSNLIFTIGDVRLVNDTSDVFFSVTKIHLQKDVLLAELPLGITNIGETPGDGLSISLNFFEVEGSSPGTSSDIGQLFQTVSPIPTKITRVVAPGSGSFNVHYSIDKLLPNISMVVGEPILLPKPIEITENVEFRDGERADITALVNYSIGIPVVAAGSRRLIGSSTLQINTFVGGQSPLASERLIEYVAEHVEDYRGSVGWLRYMLSGIRGEEKGFYVAECHEKHMSENSALLNCENVYRAAFRLFEWRLLF